MFTRKGLININNVISYNITETENIGVYDINTIALDKVKNTLTILTCIPIYFNINIYSFNISVSIKE